eukprot:3956752-Pleurochrysis_carterae.AAC.1
MRVQHARATGACSMRVQPSALAPPCAPAPHAEHGYPRASGRMSEREERAGNKTKWRVRQDS